MMYFGNFSKRTKVKQLKKQIEINRLNPMGITYSDRTIRHVDDRKRWHTDRLRTVFWYKSCRYFTSMLNGNMVHIRPYTPQIRPVFVSVNGRWYYHHNPRFFPVVFVRLVVPLLFSLYIGVNKCVLLDLE